MKIVDESIRMLDLPYEIARHRTEIDAAIARVLDTAQFVLGPEVSALEEEIARYIGVKHAIGLNSGTDALVIGLRALGIRPDDEVITTPFTFFATAEAISLIGATPVFVDVDPETFNMNPDLIEAHITPRTKAIIPVHLFGQCADMRAIRAIAEAHDLKVLEDMAQALGATYGEEKAGVLGHAAAISFYPTKVLGAYGDAGMLVTDDDDVAEEARMLRAHGEKRRYHNERLGYNSRLDSLQAAILRVKLPYLDEWINSRRAVADMYRNAFQSVAQDVPIQVPVDTGHGRHVYHQYTIQVDEGRRDAIQTYLAHHRVDSVVYYPVPLHQLPVYKDAGYGAMPVAESLSRSVLSLPIWPHMTSSIVEHVAGLVVEGYRSPEN